MINLEFTERINALRRELIDAIIAELNNHGVTSLDFPDDLERCERPWQVCTDGVVFVNITEIWTSISYIAATEDIQSIMDLIHQQNRR